MVEVVLYIIFIIFVITPGNDDGCRWLLHLKLASAWDPKLF